MPIPTTKMRLSDSLRSRREALSHLGIERVCAAADVCHDAQHGAQVHYLIIPANYGALRRIVD